MTGNASVLSGKRLLICRPEPEATRWADRLSADGALCQVLPCMHIEAVPLPPEVRQCLIDLDHFHKVIVTSQHALRPAFAIIDDYWPQLPIDQPWLSIGRKTAQVLQTLGIRCVNDPDTDLSSEQLLGHPALAEPQGDKILLLKGAGGRDEIVRTLEQRGATVVTLDLYQRQLPDYTDELLTRILLDQHYDAILALSGETVVNLVQLSRRAGASLATIPICVPSVRVAKVATQEGFKLPYVLPGTSASELAAALHKAPGFVSGPTDTEQETSNRDRH